KRRPSIKAATACARAGPAPWISSTNTSPNEKTVDGGRLRFIYPQPNQAQEFVMQVSPYLMFKGNCEEAFKFYEKALGGKIEAMVTHQNSPMAGQTPPEWGNKIIHARIRIGNVVLMASDAPPSHQQDMKGFSINLMYDTKAEAERIFNVLAEKGTVS